jgi:hypothetical protein
MRSRLRYLFRRIVHTIQIYFGLERLLVLNGQIRCTENRKARRLLVLADAEVSVFSQWGEDGVIDWLIERLALRNETFVEFGVEDFSEANARFLLLNRLWKGFIIDSNPTLKKGLQHDLLSLKYHLESYQAFIDRDNVASIIDTSNFGARVGLLSVDIDGVDYWVLEAIRQEADLVIVEYNDFLGPLPVSVPYDPKFVRYQAHYSGVYWGASLSAFESLLSKRGYVFAGTNRAGTNAFFVHGDHADKLADALEERKAFSASLRDTRNANGELSGAPYRAFLEQVSSLPLINVETSEIITVGTALAQAAPARSP